MVTPLPPLANTAKIHQLHASHNNIIAYANALDDAKASNTYVKATYSANTWTNEQLATKAANSFVTSQYTSNVYARSTFTKSAENNYFTANNSFASYTEFSNTNFRGSIDFSGAIETVLYANAHNYAPSGGQDSSTWKIEANSAPITITGIATSANGKIVILQNISGVNPIILLDESTFSSAANRFSLTGTVQINPGGAAILQYDDGRSRWRVLGSASGGGSVGGMSVSNTEPTLPQSGDMWYNLNTGGQFVYLNDGDSTQWVEIGGSGGGYPVWTQNTDMNGFNMTGNTTATITLSANATASVTANGSGFYSDGYKLGKCLITEGGSASNITALDFEDLEDYNFRSYELELYQMLAYNTGTGHLYQRFGDVTNTLWTGTNHYHYAGIRHNLSTIATSYGSAQSYGYIYNSLPSIGYAGTHYTSFMKLKINGAYQLQALHANTGYSTTPSVEGTAGGNWSRWASFGNFGLNTTLIGGDTRLGKYQINALGGNFRVYAYRFYGVY